MRLQKLNQKNYAVGILLGLILFLFPTILEAQEKIAFQSNRDGNYEVYVMNSNGSGPQRMTVNSSFDGEVAFSPGGGKIAFTSTRDGNGEIYIMNADGSVQTNLTQNPATDGHPTFSPDGSKIAFVSGRDGHLEIWIMNSDGSNPVQLTTSASGATEPAFSPDGKKIIYQAHGNDAYGSSEIFVMNADGSNPKSLMDDEWDDVEASFSPDGAKIVFASNRDGFASEIFVMNTDGSNVVNLTNHPLGNQHYPAYSPDGTHIIFSTYRDGNEEIYVMDANGQNQVNLTLNLATERGGVWGPANVAPVLSNLVVTPSINEGGTATLTGEISDENAEDSFTLSIDWGDGNGSSLNLPTGTTSFETTHVYVDDPVAGSISDDYIVSFTVNDHRFGTDTESKVVTVNNVSPIVTDVAVNPTPVVVGSTFTLSANYTDPGYHGSPMDEQLSAFVNWGDGQTKSLVTTGAPGSISETHQYSAAGSYTISIQVSDNDAGTTVKTIDVVVSPPPPPSAPSGFRVDSIAMHRIQLVWTDTSNNEDGFTIERCAQRGCNNFLEIGRVFPNQQAFLDTQLFSNTQYYYRMRAFNAGGYSAYTDVVSAKTLRK